MSKFDLQTLFVLGNNMLIPCGNHKAVDCVLKLFKQGVASITPERVYLELCDIYFPQLDFKDNLCIEYIHYKKKVNYNVSQTKDSETETENESLKPLLNDYE